MGSNSQKCIWMEAGAVEYQLCPLKQNCDLCDFHKEMIRGCRRPSSNSAATLITLRSPDDSVLQFRPGLQYLPGHFWYKRIAAGRIHLGIDSFLWQFFSSIQKVITPETNTMLVRDQCFSWLVIDGGTIYLKTPIPGQIIGVNPIFQSELIQDTHLYLSAESELWVLELEIGDFPDQECLSREQYLIQTQADQDKFSRLTQLDNSEVGGPCSRISQFSKIEFSKYLQAISTDHAFIC